NQERVADSYVASRYGSWTAAQAFWQSHGWY
ncbi:peptidase M23, partial [Lactobacillaceae bacterium 24-114]